MGIEPSANDENKMPLAMFLSVNGTSRPLKLILFRRLSCPASTFFRITRPNRPFRSTAHSSGVR